MTAVDLRWGWMDVDDPVAALDHAFSAFFEAAPVANGPASFALKVRTGAVPVAPPPGTLAERSEQQGVVQHFWRDAAGRHVLVPSEAVLRTGETEALLTLAPGCSAAARDSLAMVVLEEGINATGQALVHCAALRPAGASGLVLIHAASGTGKTTTALALAGAGVGLAADDAAVIGLDDRERVVAWGLPRAVNLHRDTAAMLDWLRPALPEPWPERAEISLPLDRLPPQVRRVTETLPVLAVIELRRGSDAGLRPVSGAAALTALVTDNIGVSASGLWPVQQGRLELLVTLASQVPCHVLEVAPGRGGLRAAIAAMSAAF